MPDHLSIVTSIYQAFTRGDISAILDQLSEDVRWEEWADNEAVKASVPWLQFKHSKNGVDEF